VRFGLNDEKIQELNEKHVEPGTDTRNKCYGDWNVSTLPPIPLHHNKKTEVEYIFKSYLFV